ncbi:MAG: DNA-3-methyladenine glycosylase [Candidatus Pacebacteria bacterium]|nr:DNA-3-methyladenine glycosylase [Candidatus Paceibacterota bacterium]
MDKSFFKRKGIDVAPELLGKYLIRKLPNGKIIRSIITEVEVYDGEEDLASHASKGKTSRNEVMYEEGGIWYVYLVYGMWCMLNIVTGEKDYPSAILIRSTKDIEGPGRLTRDLKIDKTFNRKKVGKNSNLWIEDGERVKYTRTPRIGVDYSGKWALKKNRFVIKNPPDK